MQLTSCVVYYLISNYRAEISNVSPVLRYQATPTPFAAAIIDTLDGSDFFRVKKVDAIRRETIPNFIQLGAPIKLTKCRITFSTIWCLKSKGANSRNLEH